MPVLAVAVVAMHERVLAEAGKRPRLVRPPQLDVAVHHNSGGSSASSRAAVRRREEPAVEGLWAGVGLDDGPAHVRRGTRSALWQKKTATTS